MAIGKGVLKVSFSAPTVFFALHIINIIEERCAQSTFVAVVEPRTSHRKCEFIGRRKVFFVIGTEVCTIFSAVCQRKKVACGISPHTLVQRALWKSLTTKPTFHIDYSLLRNH